jgi:methionyl-tRNA formyltransferase
MFLGHGPLAEFAYRTLLDASDAADLCVPVVCSNQRAEDTWWGTAGIRETASGNSAHFVVNTERNDDELAQSADELSVNCLISVGHPWVLREDLLRSVSDGAAFNLHNAPLPRFGGFNTASHAILEGVTHFGATLHWMEPAADVGPIAFEENFEIPRDSTAKSLHGLTLAAGRRLFMQLVECLVVGKLPPRVPMTGPTKIYPRRALSEHREITDVADHDEVDRKSRAFWFPPFEPAFYLCGSKKFYVVPQEAISDIARTR